MNFLSNNPSLRGPDQADQRHKGRAESLKLAPAQKLAGSAEEGSPLLDQRVSYLKVLALSLLREIASIEDTNESEPRDAIDLHTEVQRFEAELIRGALIQTGGRQRRAARLLGTKVTTLNTKIKRYRIDVAQPTTAKREIERVSSVTAEAPRRAIS
jgi:transcriptional regulator with GAF, ATPase, and Fis domain